MMNNHFLTKKHRVDEMRLLNTYQICCTCGYGDGDPPTTSPRQSGVNLTLNPWTIQLDDTYLSTRIVSRTCRDVEKTVLILFLNKEACFDYRRIMMNNYEQSGGIWTTNCVSYNMNANRGMLVLESTPHKWVDNSFFENILKLKCIELEMNDELKIYDLNLVTNVIYFIVTNFENDADNQIITLNGVFSQNNNNHEDSTDLTTFKNNTYDKQTHLIDYMNRIYNDQ